MEAVTPAEKVEPAAEGAIAAATEGGPTDAPATTTAPADADVGATTTDTATSDGSNSTTGGDVTSTTTGDATSTTTATPAEEEPAPDDSTQGPSVADLLKEVRRTKTTDARAQAALGEAELAGASVRELAKAAYDRGKALHATPERAAAFFRWSAEKDSKYPDPVFALAQQAAVMGEIDETIRHLKEVKVRRGDKLLQQIEFDPMWEIVKDDPAVRELL